MLKNTKWNSKIQLIINRNLHQSKLLTDFSLIQFKRVQCKSVSRLSQSRKVLYKFEKENCFWN